jgi:hypothetical protein
MRRLLLTLTACALPALALALPTVARADVFGPLSLLSQGSLGASPIQQVEYAHDPAISGDGRYLVFDGSIAGATGVWRRELDTGRLEQVAGGDAELPSLSVDGRYVSFTTNEGAALGAITDGRVHEPQREAVNVYVRDMSLAPSQAGAFTVVSAVDGSAQPLTYAGGSPTREGAAAVGRSAISADGNEVAFVTTAVSNLVLYPQLEEAERARGETPKPHTPKLQVAVRYLDTRRTVLVSRCYVHCEATVEPAVEGAEGGRVYGAVYPGHSASFEAPPAYGAYGLAPAPGASISADGSTVAWIGEDVGQQAPLLAEEIRAPNYTEPLWRRIQPGSETATERVTGGSDPGNPACAASGERALPASASPTDPCQGPFVVQEQGDPRGILNENGGLTGDFVPRLSADGRTVAFVSQAPLIMRGDNFGRGQAGQESDLYVADMAGGLTRDQALTPLTELAGGEGAGLADTAPIFDFNVSPDAGEVAFATVRIQFPLGSPALVSPALGEAGMNELYDADLADQTLARVTHGYQGLGEGSEHPHRQAVAGEDPYKGQPGDGALSPSFSDDGNTLAFASTASNLVFGDGNAPALGTPETGSFDGSDAFVLMRASLGSQPTPNEASPAPVPSFTPLWMLGVTASSRPDGTVLLYLEVPGAGAVRARARSAVVVKTAHTARATRRGHGIAHRRARQSRTVATRTVATRTARTGGVGLVTLTLEPASRYRSLARRRGGLSASIAIAFSAPGHPTLHATIPATFLRRATRRARGRTSSGHRSDHSRKAHR